MTKLPKITMNWGDSAAECFDRFLLTKRANGAKDKTIDSYSQHFHAISRHLNIHKNMEDMCSDDLQNMILSMRESGLAPNSIKSYTITLKAFLSWCNTEGITDLNMKKYKGEETIKETYTDAELNLLLEKPNVKQCSFSEYRSWVIVNLLVNSGCRAATIRNIENRDVDLDNSIIYARHTKNRKALVIPLCSRMTEILRQYRKIRQGEDEDYLFCNDRGEQLTENALRCSIAKFNRRRGVSKTSIHLFRHTFARKYLVDCGGDAFTLQKLLGHSTLDMTKHYCTLFDADIVKNYDNFSPLAQLTPGSKKIRMNRK